VQTVLLFNGMARGFHFLGDLPDLGGDRRRVCKGMEAPPATGTLPLHRRPPWPPEEEMSDAPQKKYAHGIPLEPPRALGPRSDTPSSGRPWQVPMAAAVGSAMRALLMVSGKGHCASVGTPEPSLRPARSGRRSRAGVSFFSGKGPRAGTI
jgi:hypothetical protein